jgi:hypothetical protein
MKSFNRKLRIIDVLIALTITLEVLFNGVVLLHIFHIPLPFIQ